MTKVFIVDNQELMRKSLEKIIDSEEDMQVVGVARSGHDALKQIKDKGFYCDIILMEMSLPDITGDDLIKMIVRTIPRQKILILSDNLDKKKALRTLSVGAAGFIYKDTSIAELMYAIRKIGLKGRYLNPYLIDLLTYNVIVKDLMPHLELTNLEFETMIMLANGLDIKDIALKCSLCTNTILSRKVKIYNKMKMKNNVELTWYAIENKLIG